MTTCVGKMAAKGGYCIGTVPMPREYVYIKVGIPHHCTRCLINDTVPGVTFNDKGECNYCTWHDAMEHEYNHPLALTCKLEQIKKDGKGRKYDCLIGISGGIDSTYLAWMACNVWGLRALLIHFDNGWNSEIAERNMASLVSQTKADLVRYKFDVNKINKDFLMAGVHDLDIPNDIAMGTLMNNEAKKQNIKWIFNGQIFFQIRFGFICKEFIKNIKGDCLKNIEDPIEVPIYDRFSIRYNFIPPCFKINGFHCFRFSSNSTIKIKCYINGIKLIPIKVTSDRKSVG
jgi:hypothetical protein